MGYPIPTTHLRFIERSKIVEFFDNYSESKVERVLQQFFEHPNGNEFAGDLFKQIPGYWADIPLVK